MAWTSHLLSGTNVLPTASYALNQLYLLSELASGFTCTWESQTLALGCWFRPENHTCLSLSLYIYMCVQGYTQRYIKGWKVCWKPLRYEVSSMWWSSPKHTPEANPEAYLRSIPPRQTFQWGYGISRRTHMHHDFNLSKSWWWCCWWWFLLSPNIGVDGGANDEMEIASNRVPSAIYEVGPILVTFARRHPICCECSFQNFAGLKSFYPSIRSSSVSLVYLMAECQEKIRKIPCSAVKHKFLNQGFQPWPFHLICGKCSRRSCQTQNVPRLFAIRCDINDFFSRFSEGAYHEDYEIPTCGFKHQKMRVIFI